MFISLGVQQVAKCMRETAEKMGIDSAAPIAPY